MATERRAAVVESPFNLYLLEACLLHLNGRSGDCLDFLQIVVTHIKCAGGHALLPLNTGARALLHGGGSLTQWTVELRALCFTIAHSFAGAQRCQL